MATAGTLEYLISIDSSKINSGLSSAEKKVKGFGDKLSSWAVAKGQLLAKVAEKAASATFNFMKGSVAEAASFDKQISQIAATMQKSVAELKSEIKTTTYTYMENGVKQVKTFTGNLEDMAREMGATTAFTAQQAAEALNYMALAGYKTQASMDLLPSVLNLAAAGAMDLGSASEMVTQATNALGLSLADGQPDLEAVTQLIDQMAATASNSGTTVAQLGEGIRTVGANARKLSGGTAELNLVLGLLADNGIQASEGGTALRNIISKLGNPTNKAAKELKKLGVDVYDKTSGNMRSLADIFTDLNEAIGGKSAEKRAEILGQSFDIRDIRSIEALLGTSKVKWDKLTKAINESKDAAAQMADTQLDNLSGDVTKFKSALGEAKLAIVEGFTPSLRRLTQIGTKFVQRLTDAFKKKGLKGAIEEAGQIFSKFVSNLKKSDNPVLQKLGSALEWVKNVGKEVWGLITDFPGKLQEWKDSDVPGLQALSSLLGSVRDAIETVKVGFEQGLPAAIQHLRDIDTPLSNVAASGLEALRSFSEFLVGHSDLPGIVESLALAFLGFKGLEITGSLITFIAKLSALRSIRNIAGLRGLISQIQNGGIPADTTTTTAAATTPFWKRILGNKTFRFSTGVIAFLATLFENAIKPQGNDDIYNKETGELTERGKELGYTEDYVKKQQAYETASNNLRKEVLSKAGITEKQYKAMDIFWSELSLKKQGSSSFDMDRYTRKWNELKNSFEGNEEAFQKWVTKLGELGAGDSLSIEFFAEDDESKKKIEELKKMADEAAGTYTMTFNIQQNGSIPEAPSGSSPDAKDQGYSGSYDPSKFPQAKGNWMVPYDNYPSLLHRGEMVLNKSQARQFRDGEYGGGFSAGEAMSAAVEKAMSRVFVMLNGDKVGDLTTKRINKNINASSYNKLRAMGG